MSRSIRILIAVAFAALAAACTSSWEAARSTDTPAAYHRFVREHPSSRHADAARERLAFLRLRRQISGSGVEQFRRQFPKSVYLAELDVIVEEAQFEAARVEGTRAAYATFLKRYPKGTFSQRALGNAEYLRHDGFAGRSGALENFVSRFPESDHAEEARRTVRTLAVRERTRIQAVELVIEVDAATPGANGLAQRFAEEAARAYKSAALPLTSRSSAAEPPPTGTARLRIRHHERRVETELSAGRVAPGGLLASTHVTLERVGSERPIWSRRFEFRGDRLDLAANRSLLFSARAQTYWTSFFVPVATWSTDAALRPALALSGVAVAVDASGDRAAVLFGDGGFRLLDLADPARIETIAEYSRPRDLTQWTGVRIAGQRVAVYGHDGIEIVELGRDSPRVLAVLGRDQVGSIEDVIVIGDDFLLGGSRGLFRLGSDLVTLQRLLDNPIHGLARLSNRILLVDDDSLRVSTLEQLELGQIEGDLKLGRVFGPARIRPLGAGAALVWNGTFAFVDLRRPSDPKLRARLRAKDAGVVNDVARVGDRLFLLGERGLLLLDARGERVVDSVDASARLRLDTAGRHLVTVDAGAVQVIDATAFVVRAASPARRAN